MKRADLAITSRIRRMGLVTLMATALATTTACAPENKAQSGAGLGALGGALAGSLIGPSKNREQNALIGAAVGGMVGYMFGNEMDKADQMKMDNAYDTLPSGQTTAWVNPDTGNEFAITPQAAFNNNGVVCRDAQVEAIIDGRREIVTQRACRQSDGSWRVQG